MQLLPCPPPAASPSLTEIPCYGIPDGQFLPRRLGQFLQSAKLSRMAPWTLRFAHFPSLFPAPALLPRIPYGNLRGFSLHTSCQGFPSVPQQAGGSCSARRGPPAGTTASLPPGPSSNGLGAERSCAVTSRACPRAPLLFGGQVLPRVSRTHGGRPSMRQMETACIRPQTNPVLSYVVCSVLRLLAGRLSAP